MFLVVLDISHLDLDLVSIHSNNLCKMIQFDIRFLCYLHDSIVDWTNLTDLYRIWNNMYERTSIISISTIEISSLTVLVWLKVRHVLFCVQSSIFLKWYTSKKHYPIPWIFLLFLNTKLAACLTYKNSLCAWISYNKL